jgi:hypothetical protein
VKHLEAKKSYFNYMTQIGKIAIGLGIASGAILTAWLLTGDRKAKTKKFVSRKANEMKVPRKTKETDFDDSEVHYI